MLLQHYNGFMQEYARRNYRCCYCDIKCFLFASRVSFINLGKAFLAGLSLAGQLSEAARPATKSLRKHIKNIFNTLASFDRPLVK
jgi:hypothetical protein